MRTPVFAALLAFVPLLAAAQRATVAAPSPTAVQDKTQPSPRLNPVVNERAENISARMVRDLHLNGYQADRTRQINLDYTTKVATVEREQAGNPTEAERQTKALAAARDQQLQSLYSSDQYTDYFDARKRYTQLDRDYARNATASNLINAVQNPAPARANDASIGPAKKQAGTRPAPVRQ